MKRAVLIALLFPGAASVAVVRRSKVIVDVNDNGQQHIQQQTKPFSSSMSTGSDESKKTSTTTAQVSHSGVATMSSNPGVPVSPVKYKLPNTFKYHMCDMKVAVAREHTKHSNPRNAVTMENHKEILDKLVTKIGINGLRMPMIPLYDHPENYTDLNVHEAVYEHAREKNMMIFASIMPGTTEGWIKSAEWEDQKLIDFILNYVKKFKYIHYLGPFNEPYYMSSEYHGAMARIVPQLRDALAQAGYGAIKLVGPDEVKIQSTIKTLKKNQGSCDLFDVIGTHTQKEDMYGNVTGWKELMNRCPGKPIWNTEGMSQNYSTGVECSNPTRFDYCPAGTIKPPMKDGIDAGIEGWMHWAPTGKNGIIFAKTREVKERGLQMAAEMVA